MEGLLRSDQMVYHGYISWQVGQYAMLLPFSNPLVVFGGAAKLNEFIQSITSVDGLVSVPSDVSLANMKVLFSAPPASEASRQVGLFMGWPCEKASCRAEGSDLYLIRVCEPSVILLVYDAAGVTCCSSYLLRWLASPYVNAEGELSSLVDAPSKAYLPHCEKDEQIYDRISPTYPYRLVRLWKKTPLATGESPAMALLARSDYFIMPEKVHHLPRSG